MFMMMTKAYCIVSLSVFQTLGDLSHCLSLKDLVRRVETTHREYRTFPLAAVVSTSRKLTKLKIFSRVYSNGPAVCVRCVEYVLCKCVVS